MRAETQKHTHWFRSGQTDEVQRTAECSFAEPGGLWHHYRSLSFGSAWNGVGGRAHLRVAFVCGT